MNDPYPDEESQKADAEVVGSEYPQREDRASFRAGLIPDPITLEQYNRVLPNAADRIVSMAEKEQEHRHRMQEKLINAQVTDTKQERNERKLGQIFGWSIGVISIIAGTITVNLGSPIAGGFIGQQG